MTPYLEIGGDYREVLPGVFYPLYRLVIIVATLAVALLLYVLSCAPGLAC